MGSATLGGITGPVLLFLGLQQARAASVSIWLNLELVATAILGALVFRERMTRWSWLAAALVATASIVVAYRAGQAGLEAGLLVAGACLCWGFDNHWTAQIQALAPTATTFWKGIVGGFTNVAVGLAFEPVTLTPLTLLAALLVGALSYGVSIVLYIRSARVLGATRGQSLFSLAPLWGVLAAMAFLGEPFSGPAILALALVLAAVGALWTEGRAKDSAGPYPI